MHLNKNQLLSAKQLKWIVLYNTHTFHINMIWFNGGQIYSSHSVVIYRFIFGYLALGDLSCSFVFCENINLLEAVKWHTFTIWILQKTKSLTDSSHQLMDHLCLSLYVRLIDFKQTPIKTRHKKIKEKK